MYNLFKRRYFKDNKTLTLAARVLLCLETGCGETGLLEVVFAVLLIKSQNPPNQADQSHHFQCLNMTTPSSPELQIFYFKISPLNWVVHCLIGLWTHSSRNDRNSVLSENYSTILNCPLHIKRGNIL